MGRIPSRAGPILAGLSFLLAVISTVVDAAPGISTAARLLPVRFTAVDGFFEQSSVATNPRGYPAVPFALGLADKTDGRWNRAFAKLNALKKRVGKKGVVKMIFFQRHGQGTHNVAVDTYGIKAWDEYYSKLPLYLDAPLTPLGTAQLANATAIIASEIQSQLLPVPSLIASSPLSRALNTTQLVWGTITHGQYHPRVYEDLRETYGPYICDQRHNRTELALTYPDFTFSDLVNDADTLWNGVKPESDAHIEARVRSVLGAIMTTPASSTGNFTGPKVSDDLIGIVAHSGTIQFVTKIAGHRSWSVQPGGLLPMVIVGYYN
ncbi:histidine phosphatase superfamily [Fimicolochytrium jonesii]|uniref:histidine phosphatase superfamily n=1 Tax=Fimicolochytrium jonesii TaxID=1396493 RepID=UPI0022FDDB63|nr:histidine phosphatase superfamily [Fimicolochytrium jonesii]KAI8826212.1 histidine phosphatase superfamily [Fimicolochytrium jonesii]